MGNQFHLTPNLDGCTDRSPIRSSSRDRSNLPAWTIGLHPRAGLVPHRNGALGFQPIRPGVPTLTKILRDAGWYTAVIDKHPHMKPDESFPWHSKFTGSGKNPKLFGEHLQQCIQEAKDLHLPFFINANITDPHRPFRTNEDATKTPNNQGKKRANQQEADHSLPMVSVDEITVPSFLEDLPEVRREVAEYYSSIRRFDASFGEAMMALQRSGLSESTLVLFLSDHGMSFPFSKPPSIATARGLLY
ncbi:MAG: sulfatase-like hydrolase/transferase [Pirellulales bacterium]